MEGAGSSTPKAEDIASKPNRAAIVLAIGDSGGLSFKDLKARMNLGVGTLYYHIDGLKGVVTQNGSKQYVLTDEGKTVYQTIKGMGSMGRPEPRPRVPPLRAVLGEAFLFDSQVERLGVDSMSGISLSIGIVLTVATLAGITRFYDAMLFIQGRLAPPNVAFFTVPLSWALITALCIVLVRVIWRSNSSILGLAGSASLALLPIMFAMLLGALQKTFTPRLDFINSLFVLPYYAVFQGVLVIWSAYILAMSVRSVSNLNLEKTLVVVLVIVIVNLAYLWGAPLVLPTA
jgi:hypothetical protein